MNEMNKEQTENIQPGSFEESKVEGRNPVLEAFRSGRTVDKLYVLDGCQDGPVRTIIREAKKHDTKIQFVAKERLDQLSETSTIKVSLPYVQPIIMRRWKTFWKMPAKRARHRLFLFSTVSRIRTILGRLYVQQIRQELTA